MTAAHNERESSLEGAVNAPLRARIRDADDERQHRVWLRGILYRTAIWIVGVSTAVALFQAPIRTVLEALATK